jgi:hypothetical protein
MLAQLLLVFQWTAALCGIWPSSIPDAAPLHNLLSSALAAAEQLASDFPHMQADARALNSTASGVRSVEVASAPAISGGAAAAVLATSVTAAVLDVAALVLEPLGLLLHQQQEAHRKGTQLPSISVSASNLCGQLQGGSTALLQGMLAICLDQLVLHAERKLGVSENLGLMQQQATIAKQSAAPSTAASFDIAAGSSNTGKHRGGGCSGSSDMLTIAELAEGYLLQHADTLHAKQPAAPSRATVMAWRAVCERQWAAGSLPLTLQAAAAVLASTQPVAALGSACDTATAVWAMQDCGPLGGHFEVWGQGASSMSVDGAGGPDPSSSSGASTGAAGSGHTPSICTSTSTGHCNSAGSAHGLPTAVGSEPIVSIANCINKATALSAACQHVACLEDKNISAASSSTVGLACSLLATAAAALSLQGAAALPFVSAALPAATYLLQSMRVLQASAQQPAEPMVTEQQLHNAAAAGSRASSSSSSTRLQAAAAEAIPAAAGPAVSVSDGWLCLSLAADLTTTVLQLQGLEDKQAEQPSPAKFASIQCGMLLQVLLDHLSAQPCAEDSAMQLRQLQSVAYTVQLVEATVRLSADPEALSLAEACQGAAQLRPHRLGAGKVLGADKVCGGTALAVVHSALSIISRAGHTVLGCLQGQQLLQSCTSLLLTCSSLSQRLGSAATPADMALYVELLQLLQRSEALVTGGSSSSVSQSLAAGLAVAGRTLVALGTVLKPPLDVTSSSSTSLQDEVQVRMVHMSRLNGWLSACWHASAGEGAAQDNNAQPDKGTIAQASTLEQVLHDLATCVRNINQILQDRAAAAKAAADERAAAAGSDIMSDQASSSHLGPSDYASKHSSKGYDQQLQQQAPADWLLAGVDKAHRACNLQLASLWTALPPLMHGVSSHLELVEATLAAGTVPKHLLAAGEALCAAVPCSACCSSPRCTNLSGVSAGFALVRGKGCVCGGCLGMQAGEPARAVACQGRLMAARWDCLLAAVAQLLHVLQLTLCDTPHPTQRGASEPISLFGHHHTTKAFLSGQPARCVF